MEDFKKVIRRDVLQKRRQLSYDEVKTRSKNIYKRLKSLRAFQESKSVLIYVAMSDEVQTNEMLQDSFDDKKIVAVPIVRKMENLLLLSVLSESHVNELSTGTINNESTNWSKSKFGIFEPSKDTVKPISISEIDLIIVPGLGFDKSMMRLGFGGGHYDRLLEMRNEATLSIAVAFDFQVYPQIPHCAYDQKVDIIITDKEIIQPDRC